MLRTVSAKAKPQDWVAKQIMKKIFAVLMLMLMGVSGAMADRIFVTAHNQAYTDYYQGRGYVVNETNSGGVFIQEMIQSTIGPAGIVYQAPGYISEPRCFTVFVREKGLAPGRWHITKYNPATEAFEFAGHDSTLDCFLMEGEEQEPDRFYDMTWVPN